MGSIWPIISTLIPSIGIGYLFYVIMKHIFEGDRRERLAHSQWEAEQERAKAAELGHVPPSSEKEE